MKSALSIVRFLLLTGVIAVAATAFEAPVRADGDCEADCGCDGGEDGCCVLENGALCLKQI